MCSNVAVAAEKTTQITAAIVFILCRRIYEVPNAQQLVIGRQVSTVGLTARRVDDVVPSSMAREESVIATGDEFSSILETHSIGLSQG
jgi:hypothetical protein